MPRLRGGCALEMTKRNAIVLDIDGVLLDNTQTFKDILRLQLTGDEMWDYFYNNCNGFHVPLIQETMTFLNFVSKKVHIILSTARNEKCRALTEARLRCDFVPFKKLYMRANKDFRPSAEIKKEHLQDIMKDYNIIAFIDDDPSNCEMAKALGIFTLKK